MSFAGGGRRRRQLRYSSLAVALIVMCVLHIWVCFGNHCKAGAIRVLPPPANVDNVNHHHPHPHPHVISKLEEQVDNNKKNKASTTEDLFRRFFSGISSSSASKFNQTEKGFEESKRRVPSCPDPLHN